MSSGFRKIFISYFFNNSAEMGAESFWTGQNVAFVTANATPKQKPGIFLPGYTRKEGKQS